MARGLRERLSRWWSGAKRAPARDRLARGRAARAALGYASGGVEAGGDARSTAYLYEGANLFEADWDVFSYLVTVRSRCRYEVQNSGYLEGLSRTWGTDVVGPRGPRLKVFSEDPRGPDYCREFNEGLEYRWDRWTKSCDAGKRHTFAEWLRLGERQQFVAGEDLAQLVWLDDGAPLHFRVHQLEPDLLVTPFQLSVDEDVVMGVRLDGAGAAVSYFLLEEFPIGGALLLSGQPFQELPARDVIHDYRQARPGQTRGMPWFTSVLDTAAIYRDWIKTCLVAQQHAAKFSVVLTTEHPDAEFDDLDDELPTWDLEGGVSATMPRGWKADQIKPEHPGTSFSEFSMECMRQLGRPVAMPLIRVRCDAGSSNFSSARLDLLSYWAEVEARRAELETRKCDRCLLEVQREAEMRGLTVAAPARWWAQWTWPKPPALDDAKAAGAAKERMATGQTSLADEVEDWEATLEMRKRIKARADELGVTILDVAPAADAQADPAAQALDILQGVSS